MDNQLGALIAADVLREETEFRSVRAAALNTVTVSGGFVTLVAGFLALAAGSTKDFLPSSARWTVVAALSSYVAATVVGLAVNYPAKVVVADDDKLLELAENDWDADGWDQQVAILLATYLKSLRKTNASASKGLATAVLLTILGIASTAITAAMVVAHLP